MLRFFKSKFTKKNNNNNVLQPTSLSFHLPFTFKSMRVYLLFPHSVVFALRTDHLFNRLEHAVVLEGPGPLTTVVFTRVCWYWIVLKHSLLKCFHTPGLSDYFIIFFLILLPLALLLSKTCHPLSNSLLRLSRVLERIVVNIDWLHNCPGS